ncbi:fimbria/pilus periplasmic chaperone [Enterobacter sichuanensis]|uniref:fimbria/pilus periplasmic chaperone n=1 Tax=Enterobacter sichuanensis TaxID=2071710 RepID=UPI00217EBBC6|nr:fimbria/pilus periplasmic chaperone [Enterobacter sichuanensis]WKW90264.1 Chaperone protein PapD [Enterobacter sichuanensis]
MTTVNTKLKTTSGLAVLMLMTWQAHAAIALDRTRVIYDGSKSSMSVTIINQNKSLPYLAQSWVEDANGKKIDSPLAALPPVQRVEPGAKGQIKIQTTGNLAALPQDHESLFYFNVREIPPKSTKPNTLQLALQTRVKMFYRPAAVAIGRGAENDHMKKLTLTRQGEGYQITNPTPYYVTVVDAGNLKENFKPVMVAPKGSAPLGLSLSAAGSHPVLTLVNDFGGRPQVSFSCSSTCAVTGVKAG